MFGPALAPKGQSPTSVNSKTRPLAFLRSLGCVDSKLRKDRKSTGCKGFKPITLDGIAYHPHSTTFAPDRGYTNPDDANLADGARLLKTVDGVQKAGGLLNGAGRSKKFDIYYDEFGYQTNPPDALLGVSLTQQASWLQWSAYKAYQQPRVRMLIQYLWRDDPINTRVGADKYGGWQSGLYRFDGNAKPSRKSFPNPFWVDLPKGRRTATVWGQVRPGGAAQVTVQKGSGSSFSTLKALTTDDAGLLPLHDDDLQEDVAALPLHRRRRPHRHLVDDDGHADEGQGEPQVAAGWQTARHAPAAPRTGPAGALPRGRARAQAAGPRPAAQPGRGGRADRRRGVRSRARRSLVR